MSLSGKYEIVQKTPLGDQKAIMTVIDNEDGTFSGSNETQFGPVECYDGKINGTGLTWKMNIKVPMAMTLEASATVQDGKLTGQVKAGFLGSMPMTGQKLEA